MDIRLGLIGQAREEALRALGRVWRGMPISEAMGQARPLSRADRSLLTQLVYGVVRHRRYLDAWIRQYHPEPLDQDLQDILRLAFFQIGFLDRIPAYAAVSAAVEQARLRNPRAKNLVNAVLRRGQDHPPQGLALGERFSHPDWLVQRWQERYDKSQLINILTADNEVPPLTLRVNLACTTRQDVLEVLQNAQVAAEPSPYVPEAIRVHGSLWLEDFAPFQKGQVTVQDESGMLVAWVLDAHPGDRVIDIAAGVGGKAIHALEKAGGDLQLTALDIDDRRLQRLQDNLNRQGYASKVQLVKARAEQFARNHGAQFDRIILDAPCSGLGVLRRRVDARWNRTLADLQELVTIQEQLLEAAWQLVRAGGVIVYSTCSSEPEETFAVIETVMRRHPDLRWDDVAPYLPAEGVREYVTQGCLVLAPGDLGMDGFFIARLEVKGAS